ncbi:putative transmembrane protein [Toxoplasma gondii TgCatPRC2]|nr:hypothetical protein TGGT1_240620 [Toxoplasma gondii GT1]KFG38822.1 putative transmembrane protein [Toxoplasma gondii p89]KFG48640.1 putative transmembrane protein [Toxoplasma gondii FOU]KFG59768.1 putative transmembrane protein [Toxoplasma gondii RUB]KFH04346.1 putative transmembrane protein [Toxoplasma gondii VAND]KFH14824.1 putative transmembrane protein [Toxoplasma gondii MAS]KYF39905.1 hypothetical protein TGARI_240620 [Toxoplasma gondii ARI]KYK66096.1 putative transmembrane protein 
MCLRALSAAFFSFVLCVSTVTADVRPKFIQISPAFGARNPPPYTVVNIVAEARLPSDFLEEMKLVEERKAQSRFLADVDQKAKEASQVFRSLKIDRQRISRTLDAIRSQVLN